MNEAQRESAIDFEKSVPGSAFQDDTAEYMLFWFSDGSIADASLAAKPRTKLDQLKKCALQLSDSLLKDYIWQRDAFNLQAVSRKGRSLDPIAQ